MRTKPQRINAVLAPGSAAYADNLASHWLGVISSPGRNRPSLAVTIGV